MKVCGIERKKEREREKEFKRERERKQGIMNTFKKIIRCVPLQMTTEVLTSLIIERMMNFKACFNSLK